MPNNFFYNRGKLILIYFLLLLNGCTQFSSKVIHFSNLPKPTGQYTVGTSLFYWVDSSRTEWYTSELNGFRKMMVQIWYPGVGNSDKAEPYMDRMNERIPAFATNMGIPSFAIHNMTNIKSNSISNIASVSGLFPIVLFSHGLGGMRTQNSVQAEELASRGYIVIALDHMYDANISLYPDGSYADYISSVPKNISDEDWWEIRLKQLEMRTGDMQFILDRLIDIKSGSISSPISGKLDLENIGIFGHSYGGTTSIWTSIIDDRIDACLTYDAWFLPIPDSILIVGIDKPYLHIGQTEWTNPMNYQNLDTLIKNSKNKKYRLEVIDANHFDFSDIPQYSSWAKRFKITGKISNEEIRGIMNDVTLEYFDHFLKKSKTFDPSIISNRFNKLKVKINFE